MDFGFNAVLDGDAKKKLRRRRRRMTTTTTLQWTVEAVSS